MKVLLSYIFGSLLLVSYTLLPDPKVERPTIVEDDYLPSEDTIYAPVDTGMHVLATYYNPVKAQCDGDPLTTADGSKINLKLLKQNKIKWIAVSRDLLENFSMGDTVRIEVDHHKLAGNFVIHDVMNKRFTKRIDYLTHDRKFFDNPTKVKLYKK